jgi:hypothetical protein
MQDAEVVAGPRANSQGKRELESLFALLGGLEIHLC